MTPLAYYGLSFNPFDKQPVREKDRFLSANLKEMTSRLDYLKDSRGIGVFTASPGMFKAIQEQVYSLYKEKRKPLLLAVDKAQYLSTGILNDIKMLMSHGYDSLNCFTLVLCGEPHLNSILRRPVHEALRQRITVHYNFVGLGDSEVAEYIAHKITCAGGSRAILDNAALSAVHSHSNGNPRLIDNLMTDALTLGSQMDKKTIDAEVILAAVAGQNLM